VLFKDALSCQVFRLSRGDFKTKIRVQTQIYTRAETQNGNKNPLLTLTSDGIARNRFRLQTPYCKRNVQVVAKSRPEEDKKENLFPLPQAVTLYPALSPHFTE